MRSSLIFNIVSTLFVNAAEVSSYSCNDCFANSGKYCLNDNDFTKGNCFDPYDTSIAIKYSTNQYCVNSAAITPINNSVLRSFVCA